MMTDTLETSKAGTASTNIKLGIQDIIKKLPHKYPFLMVDRVEDCEPGVYAKAYKNISANEPQFQGHFPDLPIMPGVLQLEALAQTCCLCMLSTPEYEEGFIGIFTGLDNVKFRKMVKPGDKLELEAKKMKFRFPFGKFEVKASVDGEDICTATLSFAMVKNEDL